MLSRAGFPGRGQPKAYAQAIDAETTALLARMSVQPDATRQGHINDLIAGLKSDGIWSKLGSLYVYAAHDSQAALLNWIRNQAAINNGCMFTTDRGFTSQAPTGWIDWNETFDAINDAAGGGTVNAQSYGCWCNASPDTGTGGAIHLGSSGTRSVIQAAANGGNESVRLHSGASVTSRVGTTRLGHRTLVRTDGSNLLMYYNGVAGTPVASGGGVIDAGRPATFRFGGGYAPAGERLLVAYLGGMLDATDVSNLHNRINAYKTAVGA